MTNKEKALLTYKALEERKRKKKEKYEKDVTDYVVKQVSSIHKKNHKNTAIRSV